MRIEGEHIVLRIADKSDVQQIFEWENDHSNWLVSGTVEPYSANQIEHFIEHDNDIFAANQCRFMIDSEGSRIGCIDLFEYEPKHGRVGIGVLVDPQYRGKGFAKEALQILIPFCRDTLKTKMLFADVLSNNESSINLFVHAGFEEIGVRKNWIRYEGEYLNQHMFQLSIE